MKKLIAILCLLAICLGMVACGYEKSPIEGVSLEVYEAAKQMLEHIESEAFSKELEKAVAAAGLDGNSKMEAVDAVVMQEVEKQLSPVEAVCTREEDKAFFQEVIRPYAFGAAGYSYMLCDIWFDKLLIGALLTPEVLKYDYQELQDMKNNRQRIFYDDFLAASTIEDLSFVNEAISDADMMNIAMYALLNV